jgi:hypothetical protein
MANLRRDDVDLGPMLERAGDVCSDIAAARIEARTKAVRTLRKLETRMRAALAGDVLRGMKSLLPSDCLAFQAATIHGSRDHGIDTFLAANGRPCLVWTKNGELHSARKVGSEGVSRSVDDAELTAQDLEPAVMALSDVLIRHLERAEETLRSYEGTAALCDRLADALAGDE